VELPRTHRGVNSLNVEPFNQEIEVRITSGVGSPNILLNKADAEALIIMLEFYKQEVWGAE
jgi:hypothetical protein